MRRGVRPWAALAGFLCLWASQPGSAQSPPAVLVVSLDGLRPDAIERFDLVTLQALMREGSHAPDAHTVLPSETLPSHASMLTGVSPAVHGLTWNRYRRGAGVAAVPTVFELARAAGLRTAAFYAKAKLRHLDRPGSYDYRVAPRHNRDLALATDVVPEAVQYLRHRSPDLVFVHVAEPDYAGHVMGWMSTAYAQAARRADAAVGVLLKVAEEVYGRDGFVVLVTGDHGGEGRRHGGAEAVHTRIPWIVHGSGVVPGVVPGRVRTEDTAATVLWLLGLPLPDWFEGRPVLDAFGVSETS
jgi:predicted AlkP superfamily pyrophosphatase or phosphodiesterase